MKYYVYKVRKQKYENELTLTVDCRLQQDIGKQKLPQYKQA